MSWRRILVTGIVCALLAGGTGLLLGRLRLGSDLPGAIARAHTEVRLDFDGMTALLATVASAIAADVRTAQALEAVRTQHAAPDAARALFDIIDARIGTARGRGDVAVTVYGMPSAIARAWGGRPSDIPVTSLRTPRAWFVTPSQQGLRLVHVVPVVADGTTVGVVAAEHALSPAPVVESITPAEYQLPTRFGPASLRLQYEGAGEQARTNAFVLRSPAGDVLIEAAIRAEQVDRARTSWRRDVAGVVLGIIAVTLILLIGPLLDRRSTCRAIASYFWLTFAALVLLLGGAATTWAALDIAFDDGPGPHVLILVFGATVSALAALLAAPVSRLRAAPRPRQDVSARPPSFVAQQFVVGLLAAAVLVAFASVLRWTLAAADVDLRHFSLHPWSAARLTLLAAVLAAHLAALWATTLLEAAAVARWRVSRRRLPAATLTWTLWTLPTLVVAVLAHSWSWPLPPLGIALTAMACATAALFAGEATRWFRHATVAARILALFGAFWLPSLLLYPSVSFYTDRAVRTLVTSKYAVEAQTHSQTLLERLYEASRQIDALPTLPRLLARASPDGPASPATESAFVVWKQTALARERLTSAVELYDANGGLVGRFALNFPEYPGTIPTPRPTSCHRWEVFGEAAAFGAEERRLLHAERSVCEQTPDGTRVLGAIILHVVLDYRTLPFITSQSPYFEVFRPVGGAPAEGATGSDVDIVVYGWGLTPLFASGAAAWPITDDLFARIYGSREPFWTELKRGNVRWHVFFSNDRNGIYGLGYPALTLFDRFVHLAELTTLAGAAYVTVLFGTALLTRIARERPRVGRALLREIRASFYRKLFLAFVLASIIPVVALAIVIRAYFEGMLRADVEAQAARAASVAKRVIEESNALQRRAGEPLAPASDDGMVLIGQVIDQDVNIFAGPDGGGDPGKGPGDLLATSERDLFASGLLPTRTPDRVYRAIVLQRLPSYVDEDRIGDFPYVIAATPVSVAGNELVLTVPLATQQREIEREVDELDRGVHLAALFFILLGAAMGLSMAERIADPVRRLTRATRRIASGDFDARIAVKSSDELRRLVDAFNSMAAELKAQQTQLERTHRLEAWAEMARQVAHEIKNPLTPIQLSAEHLRRVHADRGEPMGPVLESCVSSILGQVRLLRRISSEFSNFASSPTARPAAVDLPELVAEVVDPYRTGLGERVTIDNQVTGPMSAVFVDRALIGRALANIVENALHAMPGQGSLTLTAEEEAAAIELRIRDTGAGMDEEALGRVFEPYFSTKASGTGLGLPIARRNIELSGGEIHVESARGEGTTVRLRLPLAPRSG